MNIMQVSLGLFDGGVTSHLVSLCKEMIKNNNKVILVTFKTPSDKNDNTISSLGVKIYYLPFNKLKKNPLLFIHILRGLIRIIMEEKIDIIHSHFREPNIFIQLISKLYNVPYVWTYHLTGVKYSGMSRLLSFHGNRTIAVSNECKDDLVNRLLISDKKIDVIFNGIDINKYVNCKLDKKKIRNKYKIGEDKYVISIIARLVEIKGHMDALSAVQKLKETFPNICLLIAGEASQNEEGKEYKNKLTRYIEEYGIKENVKMVGFQDPREILKISNLSILPSYQEGFGIVCLEAMAMGVPVIRTRTAGWNDMNEYCEVIEIGDINQLVEKIKLIYNNSYHYKQLAEKGINFVKENFSDELMYKKIMNVYEKLII